MADINSSGPDAIVPRKAARSHDATPIAPADADHEPAAAVDDGLIGVVELLFFAYRDFTGEADAVLTQFDFGRAHHRVLHFVNRRPGLRVADLLDILRITKQSLARVLKQLVDRGFICQEAGPEDRRERRLYLTDDGAMLARRLAQLQTARIRGALDAAGPQGETAARAFLAGMIGSPGAADSAAAELGAADPGSADPGSDRDDSGADGGFGV